MDTAHTGSFLEPIGEKHPESSLRSFAMLKKCVQGGGQGKGGGRGWGGWRRFPKKGGVEEQFARFSSPV